MDMAYIDDVPVSLGNNQEILALIDNWLTNRQSSRHIITLNALMLMAALSQVAFKEIMQRADLVTVDGWGIERVLWKKGLKTQRFTGVDLTKQLLKQSCQKAYSVYFFGGTAKVVTALKKVLLSQWPGLIISGVRDGYGSSQSQEAILNEIVCKQPHILLVGLGAPQQELFLAKILPCLDATIGIGVGGTFEVLCGLKQEAPKFIRTCGLEWCFRMIQEPQKMRQFPDLLRFWFRYMR